jgi:hypothetical protein
MKSMAFISTPQTPHEVIELVSDDDSDIIFIEDQSTIRNNINRGFQYNNSNEYNNRDKYTNDIIIGNNSYSQNFIDGKNDKTCKVSSILYSSVSDCNNNEIYDHFDMNTYDGFSNVILQQNSWIFNNYSKVYLVKSSIEGSENNCYVYNDDFILLGLEMFQLSTFQQNQYNDVDLKYVQTLNSLLSLNINGRDKSSDWIQYCHYQDYHTIQPTENVSEICADTYLETETISCNKDTNSAKKKSKAKSKNQHIMNDDAVFDIGKSKNMNVNLNVSYIIENDIKNNKVKFSLKSFTVHGKRYGNAHAATKSQFLGMNSLLLLFLNMSRYQNQSKQCIW